MYGILILVIVLVFCGLELARLVKLEKCPWNAVYLLLMPHLPVFLYEAIKSGNPFFTPFQIVMVITAAVVFQLYSTLRLHIYPFRENESGNVRIGILYGGRLLVQFSVLGFVLQIVYYILLFWAGWFPELMKETPVLIFDVVYTFLFVWLFMLNGSLRMLFACRRLGIVKRILICIWLWVPILNIFLVHYMCRLTRDEYQLEVFRRELKEERKDSEICAAKYPLIMLHGIGFRDLKYFNYWGRIPKELERNGARVYYGHQKAWGTIEENAADIKATVERALEETGAEKVNIIAHSKGGLDARYLISGLHMEDKVASLTTVSTPHRGSCLIDVLNKLPDSVYHFVSGLLDKSAATLGDEHPDCYHSSKQLAPAFCEEFNKLYPDAPGIYYQSYASVMKNMFSDSILSIPHFVMCLCGCKDNDGLVTIESAKWGEFKGTFRSKKNRGISHGDMIDLKREDYKGFDVIEEYIQIVKELKEKGF